MYKHIKYTKSIKLKASSSKALSNRLNVNKKYSKKDLSKWLFQKYKIKKNFKILEVGAGLGQHVIKESKIVGRKGFILAVDNSSKSLSYIKSKKLKNVETFCIEMDELPLFIEKKKILFDRILTSYSIYYANNPILLIRKLISFLSPNGEIIITVPNTPHTLVEMINSKSKIPSNVTQSLYFGKKILKPYLLKNYKNIKTFDFKNELKLKNFEDLYNLYASSTFFIKKKEKIIKKSLYNSFQISFKKKRHFKLKKSALMIIIKNKY